MRAESTPTASHSPPRLPHHQCSDTAEGMRTALLGTENRAMSTHHQSKEMSLVLVS